VAIHVINGILSGLVFSYFNVFYFPTFLFFKLSKVNHDYPKIQKKTLLKDASAMIFIDF